MLGEVGVVSDDYVREERASWGSCDSGTSTKDLTLEEVAATALYGDENGQTNKAKISLHHSPPHPPHFPVILLPRFHEYYVQHIIQSQQYGDYTTHNDSLAIPDGQHSQVQARDRSILG